MEEATPSTKEVLNLIVQLDANRKAFLRLLPAPPAANAWCLDVRLYYQGARAGKTRFTLEDCSQHQAEAIARNIKSNSYLMSGINKLLWGLND